LLLLSEKNSNNEYSCLPFSEGEDSRTGHPKKSQYRDEIGLRPGFEIGEGKRYRRKISLCILEERKYSK
jgi:hypothetical protein